jgi:hypothetical protein
MVQVVEDVLVDRGHAVAVSTGSIAAQAWVTATERCWAAHDAFNALVHSQIYAQTGWKQKPPSP